MRKIYLFYANYLGTFISIPVRNPAFISIASVNFRFKFSNNFSEFFNQHFINSLCLSSFAFFPCRIKGFCRNFISHLPVPLYHSDAIEALKKSFCFCLIQLMHSHWKRWYSPNGRVNKLIHEFCSKIDYCLI